MHFLKRLRLLIFVFGLCVAGARQLLNFGRAGNPPISWDCLD